MKTCTVCNSEKEKAEMSQSPASVCRDCYPAYKKKQKNAQSRRRYKNSEERRARQRETKKAWDKNHPEKIKMYNERAYEKKRAMTQEKTKMKMEQQKKKILENQARMTKIGTHKPNALRKNPHVHKYGALGVPVGDLAAKYGWCYGQVFKIAIEQGIIILTAIPASRSCLYEATLRAGCHISVGKMYVEKAGFAPQDAYKLTDENGTLTISKVEKVEKIEKNPVNTCLNKNNFREMMQKSRQPVM